MYEDEGDKGSSRFSGRPFEAGAKQSWGVSTLRKLDAPFLDTYTITQFCRTTGFYTCFSLFCKHICFSEMSSQYSSYIPCQPCNVKRGWLPTPTLTTEIEPRELKWEKKIADNSKYFSWSPVHI